MNDFEVLKAAILETGELRRQTDSLVQLLLSAIAAQGWELRPVDTEPMCVYCGGRIQTETGTFEAKNDYGEPCHLMCRDAARKDAP